MNKICFINLLFFSTASLFCGESKKTCKQIFNTLDKSNLNQVCKDLSSIQLHELRNFLRFENKNSDLMGYVRNIMTLLYYEETNEVADMLKDGRLTFVSKEDSEEYKKIERSFNSLKIYLQFLKKEIDMAKEYLLYTYTIIIFCGVLWAMEPLKVFLL